MKCTTKSFGEYVHVDNGGWKISVEVDCTAEFPKSAYLCIEDGYYGYSGLKLTIHEEVTPDNLRKLAEQLILAARELEQ